MKVTTPTLSAEVSQVVRVDATLLIFSKLQVYQALATFSNTTLSSFYFDVIKDSLYADAKTSLERRRVVYTLQKVLDTYTAVLAPMAPLLAEEIHHFAQGASADPPADATAAGSVFEQVWPQPVSSLVHYRLQRLTFRLNRTRAGTRMK